MRSGDGLHVVPGLRFLLRCGGWEGIPRPRLFRESGFGRAPPAKGEEGLQGLHPHVRVLVFCVFTATYAQDPFFTVTFEGARVVAAVSWRQRRPTTVEVVAAVGGAP